MSNSLGSAPTARSQQPLQRPQIQTAPAAQESEWPLISPAPNLSLKATSLLLFTVHHLLKTVVHALPQANLAKDLGINEKKLAVRQTPLGRSSGVGLSTLCGVGSHLPMQATFGQGHQQSFRSVL